MMPTSLILIWIVSSEVGSLVVISLTPTRFTVNIIVPSKQFPPILAFSRANKLFLMRVSGMSGTKSTRYWKMSQFLMVCMGK